MGSAAVQGELLGRHAQDYAAYLEQVTLPLNAAALDAAHVTAGTRLLDAGCGAGILALPASLRGAQVTVLDASPALLAIARTRLPGVDVHESDLESLPFADASFDAVTVVNSIFYAADMMAAMRELVRVVRPKGRVVITAWGPPERCEFLRAALAAVGPLMPPPPPGDAPGHPGALSKPGELAATLTRTGLRVVAEREVACPFVFPNTDISSGANASAGPNQMAIAHSGEAKVRAVLREADRAHTRPDGTIRYENVFLWAAGVRA